MALPLTFLILLVSTLGIIAFTYYFAVEKVNSQGQSLKVSAAKQNLISLDETIISNMLQPGSSLTFDFTDSGELINIQPTANVLTLSVNGDSEIHETIYSSSIGKVTYQLPYSSTSETGLYLKGDSRTITNQSGATTTQLFIAHGAEHQELQLRYRPTVTYLDTGMENNKPSNNIRIYIINLNASDTITMQGDLPLKTSCTSTQLIAKNYEISHSLENLEITSGLDGEQGSVVIPISSSTSGAFIHVEIVISNVSIERLIR
jgi:hypothetical protein